jgi:small-conductance mechanosensitive channel
MRRFDLWFKGLVGLLVAMVLWSVWAQAQTNINATVEFAQPTFTAAENAGVALIALRRSGPTNAPVSVMLTASAGTASPREFAAPVAPIQIPAGKTTHTVELSLMDDEQEDGNKTVRLSLSDATGASLGAASTAQLLITDNEARRAVWLTFGLDRVPWMRETIMRIPLWQYIASFIYIFLAFYVSKLVDFWISGALKRWAARTRKRFDDIVLELFRGPIKVIAFVILLHLGLRIFSWPQWFADFLSKALRVAVAVSLTYMTLRFIDLVTGYWKQRTIASGDVSFAEQLLPIVRNTLQVFAVVVAVLLTLQNLGLNITSLITSLGITGLALALAAQDTLSNFFGAIVILVDKPFRIGDVIKIEVHEGTVETIGFRSTRVRTTEGHLVTIPNRTVGNTIVRTIRAARAAAAESRSQPRD